MHRKHTVTVHNFSYGESLIDFEFNNNLEFNNNSSTLLKELNKN